MTFYVAFSPSCSLYTILRALYYRIINTMLQLAVDEKRSRRKMVQEAGESRSPLRRHSTLSLTPPALANSSSSRRTGMRSRGLKKILSRERENALSPRVSTKGMSKKETAPPVAVPVPSSSIPSKELYRSIHEESLLDGTSSDKQNTPTIPSAAGERPLPLPSGPASSSTAYPANPANPANSSKTVPMGDLSESDSDTDSQSSGKDSCSKASTMTRSGSSTSISIGHTKKVCFPPVCLRRLHTCGITSTEYHFLHAHQLCLQTSKLYDSSLFVSFRRVGINI